MDGKKFAQKLKLGLAGLAFAGSNYFNSFNAIAQENYKPKYNTIAHKMLMIEDETSPNWSALSILKYIDKTIDNSKTYIKPKKNYTEQEAKEILKKIYEYNKKEINIWQDPCYRGSLIFLALAQANKLPLHLVRSPYHILVRWDPDGQHDAYNQENPVNQGDFNFETTTGEVCTDTTIKNNLDTEYPASSEDLKQEIVKNKIFLNNLDEEVFLSALAYLKSAYFLSKDGATPKEKTYDSIKTSPLELIEKSLELNPRDIEALYFKSCLLEKISKITLEKQIETENKIIELNPLPDSSKYVFFRMIMLETYLSKGKKLALQGKCEEAIKDFDAALKLTSIYDKNFGMFSRKGFKETIINNEKNKCLEKLILKEKISKKNK